MGCWQVPGKGKFHVERGRKINLYASFWLTAKKWNLHTNTKDRTFQDGA